MLLWATRQPKKLNSQTENQREEHPMAENTPTTTMPAPTSSSLSARARDYAYYKQVFHGRPMPFAYLDLDLFDENIHQIAACAGGKRIRLASKSLRSVAALRRIL